MFIRRSTHRREMTLTRMETVLGNRAPAAVPSGEALEGLRRQLLMALPARSQLRRRLGGGTAAAAYHRMASIFMAAYSGQPGIGEFDDFRKAVIEAASSRRAHLDVLSEIHGWLDKGLDPAGVKSQLEDRLAQQGIQIVWEVSGDDRSDDRFRYHGKGNSMAVVSPAYVIESEGKPPVIRQGHVECEERAPYSEEDTKSSTEDTDPNDETPRPVETSQSEDPIDTPIADPDGEDLDRPDDKMDDGIDDLGLDNTAESEDDQGLLADESPEGNENQETGEENP